MELFVSWSGERSLRVARALERWLPQVLPQVRPYLSEEGGKGEEWFSALRNQLNRSDAVIVCITKDSWHREWLHFEAGALFAANKPVCVVLLGLEQADFSGPLSHFQASRLDHIDDVDDRRDLVRLVSKLNHTSGEAATSKEDLEARLERTWPELKLELRAALHAAVRADRRKENAERHEEVMTSLHALDRYYRDILYLIQPPGGELSLIDHVQALHRAHRDIIEKIRPDDREISIGGPPH